MHGRWDDEGGSLLGRCADRPDHGGYPQAQKAADLVTESRGDRRRVDRSGDRLGDRADGLQDGGAGERSLADGKAPGPGVGRCAGPPYRKEGHLGISRCPGGEPYWRKVGHRCPAGRWTAYPGRSGGGVLRDAGGGRAGQGSGDRLWKGRPGG